MESFRLVYHIVTAKGAVYTLYGKPQTIMRSLSEFVEQGLAKALSRNILLIEDYGQQNIGFKRLYSFNQYNLDSIEVSAERW